MPIVVHQAGKICDLCILLAMPLKKALGYVTIHVEVRLVRPRIEESVAHTAAFFQPLKYLRCCLNAAPVGFVAQARLAHVGNAARQNRAVRRTFSMLAVQCTARCARLQPICSSPGTACGSSASGS